MRLALLPGFQPGPARRLHLVVRNQRREVVLTGRRSCSSLKTEPFEQFVFLASAYSLVCCLATASITQIRARRALLARSGTRPMVTINALLGRNALSR